MAVRGMQTPKSGGPKDPGRPYLFVRCPGLLVVCCNLTLAAANGVMDGRLGSIKFSCLFIGQDQRQVPDGPVRCWKRPAKKTDEGQRSVALVGSWDASDHLF